MNAVADTYRGFVYPWHLDHVGHMNVQFYVSRFDEASWHFLATLDLAPQALAAEGKALVALEQNIRYLAEVRAGALLNVQTELLEAHRKVLRYRHTMYRSDTAQVVATMELVVAYFDTTLRKAALFSEPVMNAAVAMLAGSQSG